MKPKSKASSIWYASRKYCFSLRPDKFSKWEKKYMIRIERRRIDERYLGNSL